MRMPHAHALFVHGGGPLRRVAPHAKILGLVIFVLGVSATPRDAWWVLGAEAGMLVGVLALARLTPRTILARLALQAPFVFFALALPFVGAGVRTPLGPMSLSVAGLWAAWGIVAKGTLCLGAAVAVTATTTIPDLLDGLARLRVPALFVSIAGFMVRYVDVLVAEARRARVAMAARGFRARRARDARPIANGAAALFVRSHERGERVYLAMLARGYREAAP